MLPIKAMRAKVENYDKSFLFTPTNSWLIKVPSPGEITVLAKSIVPVKNANVVASILLGVIFANNAIIGRV